MYLFYNFKLYNPKYKNQSRIGAASCFLYWYVFSSVQTEHQAGADLTKMMRLRFRNTVLDYKWFFHEF
jgi:hypothetical protein